MATQENRIKIVALQGSVRPANATAKALGLVQKHFGAVEDVELRIIDPTNMDIRLPGLGDTEDSRRMQAAVRDAAGILLATPEYHGSFSSVMKLLIENLGFPSAMKGKPIALLGVAAGRIGAIKSLESLRSVASHVGGLVLPGTVSIAGVHKVFDAEGACLDPGVELQIGNLCSELLKYIRTRVCPLESLEAIVRDTR